MNALVYVNIDQGILKVKFKIDFIGQLTPTYMYTYKYHLLYRDKK